MAAVLGAILGTPTAALADPGDVIVRFEAGADAAERTDARDDAGTEFEQALPVSGMQLVDPEAGVSAEEAVARLERSDDVLYAEPDVTRSAILRPNDFYYSSEWGLNNTGQSVAGASGTADADIDAPAAWDRTTGNASLRVAVVDTGVDMSHVDLSPNIWRNTAETVNGRDDDRNGFVDDTRGWDFVADDNVPTDANGHGTHVAGTLGARGNDSRGVAGVAWRLGIIPLRVLDANGTGNVSDIIAGYGYAAGAGAKVVNASLAGPSFSRAEYDAIRAAPGTLFVVGAGNDGNDNDVTGTYPCNHPLGNVICVGATDQNDRLAGFSNYGRRAVDLAAPGVNIVGTLPGDRYGFMSGTSMATPHVAGVVSLMWSRFPDASVPAVRASLLGSTDRMASLTFRTLTGGRLNADRAVASVPNEGAFAADEGIDPATLPRSSGPAAGGDSTPPALSARFSPRVSLRAILRKGMPVRTRCSEACTVRVDLTIARQRTANGLQIVKPNVLVGRGRGGIPRAGSKLIRVKLSRSQRRLLKRVRPNKLVLRAVAADPAGNKASLKRSLRLRR